MDTILLDQIIVIGCLLVGNIIFGSIPFALYKVVGCFSNGENQRYKQIKVKTFLLYVGSGIFISDSFLVLMPQVNKEFSKQHHHSNGENRSNIQIPESHSEHHHEKFPIPELVIVCAFFFTYFLQESLFCFLVKFTKTSKEVHDDGVRFCTCAKRHTECSRTFKDARPDQTLFGLKKKLMESGVDPNSTDVATNELQEAPAAVKTEILRSSVLVQAIPNYGACTNVTEPAIDNPVPVLTNQVLLPDERRLALDLRDDSRYQLKFLINNIMLSVALILQCIFLGIQFGTEANNFKNSSYLTKCIQNFILTLSAGSYLASGTDDFLYSSIFIGLLSIASPAGVISTVINQVSSTMISPLAKGIVLASGCGSLLYTTFYEILHQKSYGNVTGLTKFFAIVIGFSLMAFLQYSSLRS